MASGLWPVACGLWPVAAGLEAQRHRGLEAQRHRGTEAQRPADLQALASGLWPEGSGVGSGQRAVEWGEEWPLALPLSPRGQEAKRHRALDPKRARGQEAKRHRGQEAMSTPR